MRQDVQRRRSPGTAVSVAVMSIILAVTGACASGSPVTLLDAVQADTNRQIARLGVTLVAPVECSETPPTTLAPPPTRPDLPPTSFPGPPPTTAPTPEVGIRCNGTAVDQRPVVADYVGTRSGDGLLVIMLGTDQLFYGRCPNCTPEAAT